MEVKFQTIRFSMTTDLLSAGHWYAQPQRMDMLNTKENNSDQHKWPENIGT